MSANIVQRDESNFSVEMVSTFYTWSNWQTGYYHQTSTKIVQVLLIKVYFINQLLMMNGMIAMMTIVALTCLTYQCNSFVLPHAVRTRVNRALSMAVPRLSMDDIAMRWRVTKYGQGFGSYNGIEWLDRTLEAQVITIQMSRVGGLGLELNEYNVGKDDTGLILIGGVKEGSNAEKCGKFLPGDALLSIASIPTAKGGSSFRKTLEGLNFDSTLDVLAQFSPYDNVEIAIKRGVSIDRSKEEEITNKVGNLLIESLELLSLIHHSV